MSRLRVALISAGRMTSTIDDEIVSMDTWPSLKQQLPYSHAASYSKVDDVEMVAVSDLIEEKCTEFCRRWNVPRYYLAYREMIETEKPDIVSVGTDGSLHAEMSIFAIEHGVKGIYCEKPMCCSLAEADAIVAAVKKHGTKFMLGAQRRHHPNFKLAKQIAESGELGEVVAVTTWMESSLLHSLSHLADAGLFMAGDARPVWVYGLMGAARSFDSFEKRRIATNPDYDSQTNRWNGDPGCRVYTAMLENGILLNHLPAITDLRLEITCSSGYIRIVDNNDTIHVYKRRGDTYSFDPLQIEKPGPASPNRALVRNLVDCVLNDKTPLANETVALYGMELLMGAAQSHIQGGCTVKLPLDNREMYIPSY